jgi:peptide deformylase
LEWYFRNQPHEALSKLSAMRKALGIIQDSDPVLRRPARPVTLPSEAEDACRVVSELQSATHRVALAHICGKGMGIAAPQIGIERAAAIVRPPGSGNVITLFNPRVIDSSDDRDEQYEGCLSFFDVRCLVPRPLVIHVEHQDVTGDRRITSSSAGPPASSPTKSTICVASCAAITCVPVFSPSRLSSTGAPVPAGTIQQQ